MPTKLHPVLAPTPLMTTGGPGGGGGNNEGPKTPLDKPSEDDHVGPAPSDD